MEISSKEKLDFYARINLQQTVHSSIKSAIENEYDFSNMIVPLHQGTRLSCKDDSNFEYVVDHLSEHQQTAKETLGRVPWYR